MKLILLNNGAEVYPPGRFYPAKTPGDGEKLPEVPEAFRSRAYTAVFLETPYAVPVQGFQAKEVPLGQGEVAWTAELAHQYGGAREMYAARHYPTRTGAFVAGVKRSALEGALGLLRPGGRVYPLSLALAWLAAQQKGATLAFFVRHGYAVAVSAQDGEVVDVVELHDAAPTIAWLQREIAEQSRLLGRRPETVLLVDSRLQGEQLGGNLKEASVLGAPVPPELGWERPLQARVDLKTVGAVFLISLALGAAPSLFLNREAARLEAEAASLEAEARTLRVQVSAKEALERRKRFLEAVTQVTRPSPLEAFLQELEERLPQGVAVTQLSYEGASGRMEVFSPNLDDLLNLPSALSGVTASASVAEVRRSEKGWRATLSFALREVSP